MNNRKLLSILILLFCSIFIFVFAQLGLMTFSSFLGLGTYKEGTKIASVSVENLTEEQAKTKVASEIKNWTEDNKIVLTLDHSIILDKEEDYLDFQLDKTVQALENKKTTNLSVEVNEKKLNELLQTEFGQERVRAVDVKQLSENIRKIATSLNKEPVEFDLRTFLVKDKFEESLISEAVSPFANGALFNERLKDRFVIAPGSQFSLQEYIDERNLSDINNEILSEVATTIYTTILASPFELIERHISDELPSYTKLGQEAAFVKNKWDLKFLNPTDQPYELTMFVSDEHLTVQLSGKQLEEYRVYFENEQKYPTRTIVHYHLALEENETKLGEEGKEGQSIRVYRQVFIDGKLENEVKIAEDYYPPAYKVVYQGMPLNLINTPIIDTPDTDDIGEQLNNSDNPDENNRTEQNLNQLDEQTTENPNHRPETTESRSTEDTNQNETTEDEELWEDPNIEK
ncbi:VanW family protein [Metabacillus malikii]|uniref:G5 domain-containing protein n=1 Tax=Metabacillus malikii TaxID=1504265 RepID=A0ABT9ZKJ6_9BACI|nr:VanW family protein [Metabacillus malikii]MDQ0232813.1 hypothetical protein [Metabacillus malikii]